MIYIYMHPYIRTYINYKNKDDILIVMMLYSIQFYSTEISYLGVNLAIQRLIIKLARI
jgi:hypothetical protein